MARRMRDRVETYTITFPSSARRGTVILDDPSVARRTASAFGCDHHEIVTEPQVADLFEKVIWHMDEPVADPAILTAYLVCRAAAQTSTVLLSGVGGDEVFGGYRKYCAHYMASLYQKLPLALRSRVIEPSVARIPQRPDGWTTGRIRLLKKMMRSGSLSAQDGFLMHSVYMDRATKAGLLSPELYKQIEKLDEWSLHRRAFAHVAHADFLNQMLYVDTKLFMPSLNLNYNDKMSMANSIEVRVPLLDQDLFEFVAKEVSPRDKVRLFPTMQTKNILRSAMGPMLPREVLRQRKASFGAPVGRWLVNDLDGLMNELLSERNVAARGVFDSQALSSIVREHRNGVQDHGMSIWQVLTLEMWFRHFVDGVNEFRSPRDLAPAISA
jgi:asparagine synthase (glutamine-hydrolysing)